MSESRSVGERVRSTRHRRESPRGVLDLAILGVGHIGRVHLESARAMDEARVVAVADVSPKNRRRAREAGVSATYDDYRALLENESPDAVVVALPPALHAPAVRAAADAGCDVFVEKPFARSVGEAEEMLAVADDAGIHVGVDHTIRYLPGVRELAEEFRSGAVGHAPFASISRINGGPFSQPPVEEPVPDWKLDPDATGGGVVLDLGLHLFDVLEWLFGDLEVRDATMDRQLGLPFEDAATVRLDAAETGTAISMHCGSYQWEDASEMNFSLRVEGVAGTLDNESFQPDNLYTHAAKSATRNVYRALSGSGPACFEPTYYLQAHYRALAAFVEAVGSDRSPPVDGTQGLRTLELADAAYDAAGVIDGPTASRDEADVKTTPVADGDGTGGDDR
jgi:predicted dehydrogenase